MAAMMARMDEEGQRISGIEDKITENNEAEKKKRETKAKVHNIRLRELSDLLKRHNTQIEVLEYEEREKGIEGLCEQIIVENITFLGKDTDIKIQEAQKIPIRFI